jgi:hypothetical protein
MSQTNRIILVDAELVNIKLFGHFCLSGLGDVQIYTTVIIKTISYAGTY